MRPFNVRRGAIEERAVCVWKWKGGGGYMPIHGSLHGGSSNKYRKKDAEREALPGKKKRERERDQRPETS
jgi:hypothetical protein